MKKDEKTLYNEILSKNKNAYKEYSNKNIEIALEEYKQVEKLIEKYKKITSNRRKSGRMKEQAKRSKEINDLLPRVYNNLGVASSRKNQRKEAVNYLKKSIEISKVDNKTYKIPYINLIKITEENLIDKVLDEKDNEFKSSVSQNEGEFIIKKYKQAESIEEKEKILKDIIDKEFYLSLNLLEFLSSKKDEIKRIDTCFFENIRKKFIEKLKKEEFGEDDIEEGYYYIYKGINKYTIETIINKGVYKNSILKFNDPFDPYLKRYEVLLDELNKIKITCFSKEAENQLMWAHYGDNHRGICLGYKILKEKINKNKKICFLKVDYGNIEDDDIIVDEEFVKNKLKLGYYYLKKNKDWEYENESRMIHLDIMEKEEYYKGVKLKEVIFGIDTRRNDISLIKSIIDSSYSDEELYFFKMKESSTSKAKIEKVRIKFNEIGEFFFEE